MSNKKLCIAIAVLLSSPVFAVDEDHSADRLEIVSVTSAREEKLKKELAESVAIHNRESIQNVSPSHPSELLNRSAGVHVNNLGGEGHMTAIRQPITTRGVYLFLEDGVPIRPTGFFNHNALYEVNIPQSRQVEIVKGPGTALYGSDAIGGMINVLSEKPPEKTMASINAEVGSFGWKRALIAVGGTYGNQGISLRANMTDNDGYRDASAYRRGSLNLRWDVTGGEVSAKTLMSYTDVDQSGVSSLESDDYKNTPTKNYFHGDTGYRRVNALRLSSQIDWTLSDTQHLSIIPLYRQNKMQMSPSWMVTYDPNIRVSEFSSYGLLSKYRWDMADNVQWVVGVDIDYTPSTYSEDAVSHTLDGDIYTGFTRVGRNYDFKAKQTALSPYLQLETRLFDTLIATLGVRYDHFTIDYDNQLMASEPTSIYIEQLKRSVTHLRPNNQKVTFSELSPKFGLVYQFADLHDAYVNYRHAFSMPSVGTLFRSGSTQNSNALKPIKADSVELGFRGSPVSWLSYELALYHMMIKDDLVSVVDGTDSNKVNAGETEHQGVELTLMGDITEELAYALAYTQTRQTYKRFSYTCCYPKKNIDVSGNDVGKAPDNIGNLTFVYKPLAIEGLRLSLEWAHLGPYFTDETNLSTYDGHDLLHLRAAYKASEMFEVYLRGQNLTDERYSTYTSSQVGKTDIAYRVGLPRTYTAGFRLTF